ncbi:MAG TPA: hypothetical protein VFG69_06695 [Nannocystaceae bacterium]|nr:hypothetical protein [Nannocystaceae bacterium]
MLPALLGALLLVPIVVLRAPLWPFYPLVFLCGVVARARGGRSLQLLLPLIAALLGPFALFVTGASGAADLATVLHEFGVRALGEYVRQYVLAGTPLRAWLLLPSVLLLGYVAADLARFVLARTGVPRHVVRNTLLGLLFGALVFALPRVRLRLSEARQAWRLADRARDDDRHFLARASAEIPALDRTPLVARGDVRVVLIVGSSASRWDWSLYGYPRATNAPIASAADTSRLVLFTRAEVPPSADDAPTSTGLSSLRFLYRRDGDRVVPLMHTLARAGIATTWLRSGIASSRDGDALTGSDVRDAADDAELVPLLRSTLAGSNGSRLVVLESRAGRYPWCGTLAPTAREEWNDWLAGLRDVAIWGNGRPHRAALDCYDAAMRHASEEIASAIRVVDVATEPTLLLYVPARGADAWSSSGPAASARDPRVTDVPMLVYANGAFATRYPGALEGARQNRDARIAASSVHDAVLDAFGISPDGAGAFAASNSVLDESFDASSDSSALATLPLVPGDSADLARDSTVVQSVGRLCAHRDNSVLKYLEGRATYHCVELDVVLDSTTRGDGPAFVFHPPTPDPGLPLYELLARAGVPRYGMWLDVKNLTARNAPHFLARIAALVPPALRTRVIVETGNRALAGSAAAAAIADSGFVFSYYLDTELGCICSRATNPGCEDRIRQLAEELNGGSFTGLSFDARGRAVARALLERIAPRPVLNTWTPMDRCENGSRAQPLDPPARDSLLDDVQKYLVQMRSAFTY